MTIGVTRIILYIEETNNTNEEHTMAVIKTVRIDKDQGIAEVVTSDNRNGLFFKSKVASEFWANLEARATPVKFPILSEMR